MTGLLLVRGVHHETTWQHSGITVLGRLLLLSWWLRFSIATCWITNKMATVLSFSVFSINLYFYCRLFSSKHYGTISESCSGIVVLFQPNFFYRINSWDGFKINRSKFGMFVLMSVRRISKWGLKNGPEPNHAVYNDDKRMFDNILIN